MHGDFDIANFANDNTSYPSAKNIEDVMESVEKALVSLFQWFELNLSKRNADKCDVPVSDDQEVSLNVDNFVLTKSKCEKLLEVKFDSKLTLDQHILDLCKRSSRKLKSLTRIAPYMNLPKRRLLKNSFFKAEFNYCPLTWMCNSCENNRKINRPHERCLRNIYINQLNQFMYETSKF